MAYKDVISGIYTITHIDSGRVYVGSATNIYTRWNYHRSSFRTGKHCTPYLKNAWDKYGETAFRFDIIERVQDKSNLIEREQYWIDFYNASDRECGFNIAPKAGSRLGVKLSPEAIAKRSEKIRGRPRSAEFKEKAAQWMKGNNNGRGKRHGVLKDTDVLPIFYDFVAGVTIETIANRLGVHKDSINRVIKRITWANVAIPEHLLNQAQERYKNRRRDGQRANSPRTKLDKDSVAIIKHLILSGESYHVIAASYGVTSSTIQAIKHGRIWKDIKPFPSL